MQNYIKSQTRLAFVQYIFQNEFLNADSLESIDDFQKHFYDTNIAIIEEKKEIKLKFNKNFLNRLFSSFKNNIDKKNIDNFNGFISLGCIIKGDTYHFEVIANETTRKIMDLSVQFNIPIGFGVLTCYNLEQAKIRSDINQKNKGQEAALACIQLLE